MMPPSGSRKARLTRRPGMIKLTALSAMIVVAGVNRCATGRGKARPVASQHHAQSPGPCRFEQLAVFFAAGGVAHGRSAAGGCKGSPPVDGRRRRRNLARELIGNLLREVP
jgi:hypothetical protein